MRKIKVHNPSKLPTIDYRKLIDFQGDFKTLPPENLDKLKASILEHGVFMPKFVWDSGDGLKIMDGHQTQKALSSLEEDGYSIPPIPFVLIEAKDEKEAAKKLLALDSRYGVINISTEFFDKYALDIELIRKWVEIPEFGVDLNELKKKNVKTTDVTDLSDELTHYFEVSVQCENEDHQKELYDEFVKRGLQCKVLTL